VARLRFDRLLGQRPGRRIGRIEFCDQCASVCGPRCRAEALRDKTLLRALTAGRPVL
jgi:hypothetical protein